MMKILIGSSIIVILLSTFAGMRLLTVSIQQDYKLFYFVLRWPGAECSGVKGCCFSTTGKPPAAFAIHGLWPQYENGTRTPKCDNKIHPFDLALIKDLTPSLEKEWPSMACPRVKKTSLTWEHQWVKHGICSLSTLTQHGYFDAALKLKAKINLLQILKDANIEPNGNLYNLKEIRQALAAGIGFVPGIECNDEKTSKNNTKQLYEVLICVDKSGSNFMKCPVYPIMKNCATKSEQIKFPKFGVRSSELKAEL